MKKLLLISTLLVTFSCASNSLFLDAIPIGVETQRFNIGASIRGKYEDSANIKYFKNNDISILPIDFISVFGISEQLDVFVKYTLPITFNAGVKIAFNPLSEGKHFYSAIGPSLGIDLVSLLNKDSTEENSPPIYFDLRIPFYQTIYFNKYLNLSIIPNSIMRVDYRHFQMLAGCNVNTKIGYKAGIYLEGALLYNFRYKEPEYQFGVNFYFPWNIIKLKN